MNRKIAIVTGGSRGLGRNAVQHLARGGVDAIITYRTRQDEAEAVVADVAALGGRAVALQLDVTESGRFAFFARASISW
jgi:NAD(P)-dependent dehydrogenase (short-subunit alcohol dehydrogenase family)